MPRQQLTAEQWRSVRRNVWRTSGVILVLVNLATVVDMVRDGDSWFDIVSVVLVVSVGVTAILWLYDTFGYWGTRRMGRR